jgi:hypothetical protein
MVGGDGVSLTWRACRDGKTVREDHEKLKIDSVERLTCCYAHSAELPTFHRRIYWLLAAKQPTLSSTTPDSGSALARGQAWHALCCLPAGASCKLIFVGCMTALRQSSRALPGLKESSDRAQEL